jgi:anaerobic magnesium-protoporphyrin IX monomethyl ester cyclase
MHITLICADDDRWALGMRSISAALKDAGHSTRMIFPCSARWPLDSSILERVASLSMQSGLVGISSMSRGSKNAKTILEALTSLGKVVVWGGMHPTLFPQDCAGHAHLICRGEGEGFMIELAERLASGTDYGDIPNGGYLENGNLVLNELRPLIADLDKLPMVDFVASDEYSFDSRGEIRQSDSLRRSSSVLFTGSRGCLYTCHYCSNAQLKTLFAGKGRYARKMSVAKFIDSAMLCREIFPQARYFYFTDEDFAARPIDEFREFAENYPKKVGVPFECMASPQQITEEKMALLASAGMWRIDVGVESGSDRVKKEVLNRPVSNAVVMRAASIINQHPQLIAYYFFIIGNPYEKREDLLGTIGLIASLPFPCFIRTYNLVFIPGTHLFERACREGIIGGIEDSAFEIDFLSGFDYRSHAWKRSNLYLNGLISLMTGKCKRRRIGFLPRFLLPALIRPRWIDFNDRHSLISKAIIVTARGGLTLRRRVYEIVSRTLRKPGSLYDLKSLFRRKAPARAATAKDMSL